MATNSRSLTRSLTALPSTLLRRVYDRFSLNLSHEKATFKVSVRRDGTRHAKHSMRSFFIGTARGRWLVMLLIGLTLITTGALVLHLSCKYPGSDWREYTGMTECTGGAEGYLQALWLSWGIFFDPGTQTGIAVTEPPVRPRRSGARRNSPMVLLRQPPLFSTPCMHRSSSCFR